jgi:hypothetical protein
LARPLAKKPPNPVERCAGFHCCFPFAMLAPPIPENASTGTSRAAAANAQSHCAKFHASRACCGRFGERRPLAGIRLKLRVQAAPFSPLRPPEVDAHNDEPDFQSDEAPHGGLSRLGPIRLCPSHSCARPLTWSRPALVHRACAQVAALRHFGRFTPTAAGRRAFRALGPARIRHTRIRETPRRQHPLPARHTRHRYEPRPVPG